VFTSEKTEWLGPPGEAPPLPNDDPPVDALVNSFVDASSVRIINASPPALYREQDATGNIRNSVHMITIIYQECD
jgi:hypothetical protein